jgi:hypothetical protein
MLCKEIKCWSFVFYSLFRFGLIFYNPRKLFDRSDRVCNIHINVISLFVMFDDSAGILSPFSLARCSFLSFTVAPSRTPPWWRRLLLDEIAAADHPPPCPSFVSLFHFGLKQLFNPRKLFET